MRKILLFCVTFSFGVACIEREQRSEPADGQANATLENRLNERSDPDTRDPLGQSFATAQLAGTKDDAIQGSVSFHEGPEDQLVVTVRLKGVSVGEHGFHIHENGSCEDAGEAAGGHFAGSGIQHDAPASPHSHLGDLGNLNVRQDDNWFQTVNKPKPDDPAFVGWNQFVGKAVIVHARADDLVSQPAGDAGERIACGIVMAAGAETGH